MAKLSEAEKHAIVRHLACFVPPSEVVVAISAEFGIKIDRFQVRAYDPTNPRYEGGEKWRAVFEAARTRYLSNVGDIPIAHVGYRLNELQKLLMKAKKSGNLSLALSILRQAANEVGALPASAMTGISASRVRMHSAEQRKRLIHKDIYVTEAA